MFEFQPATARADIVSADIVYQTITIHIQPMPVLAQKAARFMQPLPLSAIDIAGNEFYLADLIPCVCSDYLKPDPGQTRTAQRTG